MSMIFLYLFDFTTCASNRVITSCFLLLLILSFCSNLKQWLRSDYIICWRNWLNLYIWYKYYVYLKSLSKLHQNIYLFLSITFFWLLICYTIVLLQFSSTNVMRLFLRFLFCQSDSDNLSSLLSKWTLTDCSFVGWYILSNWDEKLSWVMINSDIWVYIIKSFCQHE